MTVSTTNVEHSYFPGAAMAPENLPFAFLDALSLTVTVDEDTLPLVPGSDFVITGDSRAGAASIRVLRAFPEDQPLFILRETPRRQEAVTEPFKPLPAEVVGRELDRRAMIEQELGEMLGRALVMPRRGGVAGKYPIALANGEWGWSVGSGEGGAGTHISATVKATSEGQRDFTFPDASEAFWDAIGDASVPVEFSVNGCPLDEVDYSWSAPILSINDDHMHIDDIVGIKVGVIYDQGVVDRRNVLGLSSYLGSRRANVLDFDDWDPRGVHDMADNYQTLINQAAAAGVPVDMGKGRALLGSTIAIPGGHVFEGLNCGGIFIDPTQASSFLIAHGGKGFIRSGGNGAPVSIRNQVTVRQQPDVTGPAWEPNDHDFDYWLEDISDLKMSRILTLNATRGIYFNGGRNSISEWGGQCFKQGLQIDWSYDTCHISDIHLWPFWKHDQAVREYMQSNLRSFLLKRVDNPFFSKIFSIWHQYGFFIDWFAGDGPSKPAGTVNKLKLSQADLDVGDYAYWVAAAANGHTAKFSQVTAQGRDEIIASSLLTVEAPNVRITGDFTGDNSGGNVVRVDATALASRLALQIGGNNWNRTGPLYPAVEVEPGGGHVDVLPGSIFTNGGGAPVSSGDVTIWENGA